MYDIIIVGAGPAGLTGAIYGCRASKKVLVLEANSYGGQIVNTPDIENYPAFEHISGFDFADKLYNQARELGAEIKFEKVVSIKDGSIKEVVSNKETYKCKSIILATGLVNRKLYINEDKFVGKGVSYCATCDGAFYKDKDVAVVGGGNTAIEDALYLSDICRKVFLIHRRDKFRAFDGLVDKLKEKENVSFILNSNVTSLIGDERLEGIQISDGRKIDVSGLFIAIGKIPENQIFDIIDLDDSGYIVTNDDCHTNIPGIFAAGDNRVKSVRQLVTATSDGAIAAMEAIKYINN